MTPRHYALYITEDGKTWVTRHYEDDAAVFTDEKGVTWTRKAVSEKRYYSEESAERELIAR